MALSNASRKAPFLSGVFLITFSLLIFQMMGIRLTQLTTTYRASRLSKGQPVGAW